VCVSRLIEQNNFELWSIRKCLRQKKNSGASIDWDMYRQSDKYPQAFYSYLPSIYTLFNVSNCGKYIHFSLDRYDHVLRVLKSISKRVFTLEYQGFLSNIIVNLSVPCRKWTEAEYIQINERTHTYICYQYRLSLFSVW